jgi:polyphosphate kinase
MKRNLYRRIECDFPIYDKRLKAEILDMMEFQLKDNVKACMVNEKMENVRKNGAGEKVRAQMAIYHYFREKYWNQDYNGKTNKNQIS